MRHPLDCPVWSALTSRQNHLARGTEQALRFDPDYALFAASRDPADTAALLSLVGTGIGLVETAAPALPPGVVARDAICNQMIADRTPAPAATMASAISPAAPDRPPGFDVAPLDDGDAAEMLALAALTQPGPFFRKTHRLGDFIGVKVGGRLVAMAGERMKPAGFAEVSGVCTHPDHRGKGYAGGLMRLVAERIIARGETPFLHVYADNAGAIALYESLGFRFRAALHFIQLSRNPFP